MTTSLPVKSHVQAQQDPLPGAANTKAKVLEVFRRYPWIFEPSWPLTLWQMDGNGHRKKEKILKEAIQTIASHDRILFDQAMRVYPPSSSSSPDPLDDVVTQLFEDSLEWDLYFRAPLVDYYFGGIRTRHVTTWRPTPSEVLSEAELQHVQSLLDSTKELNGFVLADARHSTHFQRLARVIYPSKFGYAEPPSSVPITFHPVDRPIFRPVREPEGLPRDLRTFAQRTFDQTVDWIRCDRLLEIKDFQDMDALTSLWNHIAPRHRLQLRLEITLIDPLPLYERLLRQMILKAIPTLEKIRFIKKTVRREEYGSSERIVYRLLAVEDFDVKTGEVTFINRW